MKKKRGFLLVPLALLLVLTLVTTAFGIDEGDVQSAVTESSKEEVAGNIFIWFLCAIGFLKISQKIDSFMAALGINTARTGGSMLAELMIAGRSIAGAAGHSLGGMFHHGSSAFGGAAKTPAAGSAYVSNQFGHGVIGMAQQAAANKATAAATERASGLSGAVGNKMFQSSLQNGGQFATDVTHSVAMGNINQMGTMTGATAEAALAGYMGYTAAAMDEGNTFIEEADSVENGVSLNGGGAGAQPPVQGTVLRTPEEKPGETGVPPVRSTGTDVGNAAAGSPGGSHGNVIPVVPVSSVGTSFTPADLQGGAATPYTPMGMEAGTPIPREPMETTQTESETDAEMGSTPVTTPGGVVMNNTPEGKAFQQKMQFASVVGMDGGAGPGTVPGGKTDAVGTGMKTEAVSGEAIHPSVAGTQGEIPDQSTTSGGLPAAPVSTERMSGTASSEIEQKVQSAPAVGIAGGFIPGKTPDGKKTTSSSAVAADGPDRAAVSGSPYAVQRGPDTFQGTESRGISSDPITAVETHSTPEKNFEPQVQSAPIVGIGGAPVPGKNTGAEQMTVGANKAAGGIQREEILNNASGIQTEETKSSQIGAGESVKTVPMSPAMSPDATEDGFQQKMQSAPAVGMCGPAVMAEKTSTMTGEVVGNMVSQTATGVQRSPSESYQKANGVGGSAITEKPEVSVADVKNAGQMASTPIERELASSLVFDKDNAGQQMVAGETAATSGSKSQTAAIPMAPGGTSAIKQTMKEAQSTSQSVVEASAAVHDPEKSGTVQEMDIPRTAAQPVAGGGVTATTATEAVAKQSSNPVLQAEKPDGHSIPTAPGGVAIISAGAATGSKMQASAAGTEVVPRMGVTESAGTVKTSRTTDHNAGGKQTFPYQNPTGSVVQSTTDLNLASGASGETTIQMQSPGERSSVGMSPMPTTGMVGGAVTSQVQSVSTEAKTNTERVGEPGRQNSQPLPTKGIPTKGVSPQASVKSSSAEAATQMSTGALKETPVPTVMPAGVGRMDMQEHTPVSRGVDPQQGTTHRATSEAAVRSSPVPDRIPADGKLDTASAMQQSPVSNHTGAEEITRTPTVGLGTTPAVEKPTMNHAPVKTATGEQSHVMAPQRGQPMVDRKAEKTGNVGQNKVMTQQGVSTGKPVGNQIPVKPETAGKNMVPVHHEGIAGKPVQNSVPTNPAVNAQGKPKGSQVTNTNKIIEKVTPGKTEHPGIQREVTKPAVDGQKQSPVPQNAPTSLHHERPTQADNRQTGTSVPPKVQLSTPPAPKVQTGSTTGKAEPPHRVPEVKTGKMPSMPVSVPGTANTTQKPPTYTKVEIGGGRITGVETPADGGKSRPFAMYSTKQYTQPKGPHEVVKTVDGESWYKQYAQPAVQKTPKEVTEKGVKYDQQIVDQLPDAPRRKDRI